MSRPGKKSEALKPLPERRNLQAEPHLTGFVRLGTLFHKNCAEVGQRMVIGCFLLALSDDMFKSGTVNHLFLVPSDPS